MSIRRNSKQFIKDRENFIMMYGHGGNWIGMIIGLIVTGIIFIGLIVLVVWAVRRLSGNSEASTLSKRSGESAREIVRARYAKGEINREEYQMLMSDLDK